MAVIIVGIVFLLIGFVIMNFWPIAIGIVAVLVLSCVFEKKEKNELKNAVKIELTREVAKYKKEAENTGYSIGWYGDYHVHYEYRDVLDHYDCYFYVTYRNGHAKSIKCTKGDTMYRALMNRRRELLNKNNRLP